MVILIITFIILWAYVGVVLSMIAAELTVEEYETEPRDTFKSILVRSAVMLLSAPLLAWAARIDWYGNER